MKEDPNLYDVNPLQFINPTTPEVAYILGLLWADGYIGKNNAVNIQAVRTDLDLLYKHFLTTGNWKIYYRTPKNRKEQATIHKGNMMLANFLKENDYTIKSDKSACKILSIIPENLKHYWFRGVVDGDGCFYIRNKKSYQFSLASSYQQDWTYFEDLLKSLNIKYNIQRRIQIRKNLPSTQSSVIRISNKNTIKILGEYIYQNYEIDKIGLHRKYEKFLQIKANCDDQPIYKPFSS